MNSEQLKLFNVVSAFAPRDIHEFVMRLVKMLAVGRNHGHEEKGKWLQRLVLNVQHYYNKQNCSKKKKVNIAFIVDEFKNTISPNVLCTSIKSHGIDISDKFNADDPIEWLNLLLRDEALPDKYIFMGILECLDAEALHVEKRLGEDKGKPYNGLNYSAKKLIEHRNRLIIENLYDGSPKLKDRKPEYIEFDDTDMKAWMIDKFTEDYGLAPSRVAGEYLRSNGISLKMKPYALKVAQAARLKVHRDTGMTWTRGSERPEFKSKRHKKTGMPRHEGE